MANIFTNLNLTADNNFYITQKINSVGYVGENTVTRLNIEVPEITEGAVYELETENSAGAKNVALLSTDTENSTLYLDFTARMLTVNDLIMMQLRVTYTDNSIKKSNRFAMKIAKSISATDYYEEYAVSIFDQLVNECRDIIDGAESYAVRAETAAVNAEAYEQSASASAQAASASEATASTASTAAVNAATSAESASTSAHTSAETATTAAANASTSASNASTSAQTAQSASVTAQSASEAAQTASTAATSAQTAAETAATSATTAANNASASATSASTSASNAATSETNASNSATAAATSETNAAASASSASTSAANANTSATNAANSATSAATSATNAHNSEVNASTSETNASTSATEAAASAESIAASVTQINENTYRINDLEAIIAGYQLTDLPTGQIATVTDGTALLMPSLKVGIEPVQEGSGDPSPENVRPISGWTAANVMRCGKNLFNIDDVKAIEVSNISHLIRYGVIIKGSDEFSVSVNGESFTNNDYLYGRTYNSDGSIINTYYVISGGTATSANFSLTQGQYFMLYDAVESSLALSKERMERWKPQIEYGTEVTTYEPYNGQTYTIEFRDGDNPLTVYGGTLDVVNGELTVTDAYISSYNAETLPSTWISDRDVYVEGATPTTGAEVVYKLANSVTYHLTPTQIRTLVGTNNIWADTGDIIEGKYFKSLV